MYAYVFIPFGKIRMKSLCSALAGECVVQEKAGSTEKQNAHKSASQHIYYTKTRYSVTTKAGSTPHKSAS